jgi:hypothetical protein
MEVKRTVLALMGLKIFYPTAGPAPIPTITQGVGMFLQRNLPLLPRMLGFQSLKKPNRPSD